MSFSSRNHIRVINLNWYKDRNTISRGESWLPGVLLGDTESVFCKVLHGIGDTLLGPLSGEWAVEWPLSVAILSLSGELSSWRNLGWHFLKTRWGLAEPVAALNSSANEDDVCMDVWHMGKAETVSENVNARLTRRKFFFFFSKDFNTLNLVFEIIFRYSSTHFYGIIRFIITANVFIITCFIMGTFYRTDMIQMDFLSLRSRQRDFLVSLACKVTSMTGKNDTTDVYHHIYCVWVILH